MPTPDRDTLNQHQANERTMLAWIRTGIALMGFGFAIARFGLYLRQLTETDRLTMPVTAERHAGSGWVGALLVAIGMLTNLGATFRYHRVRTAIEQGEVGPPSSVLAYSIGTTTAIIGLVMVVLLLRSLSG
jgi:putative membrane protein